MQYFFQFVTGGKVGSAQIHKAQNWSDDAKYALQRVTEIVPEEKSNKRRVRRGGKDRKKGQVQESQGESGMSDKRLMEILNDMRLFHRVFPVPGFAHLADFPIQLDHGHPVNQLPQNLNDKTCDDLIKPFGNNLHNLCGLDKGEWLCKEPCSTADKKIDNELNLFTDAPKFELPNKMPMGTKSMLLDQYDATPSYKKISALAADYLPPDRAVTVGQNLKTAMNPDNDAVNDRGKCTLGIEDLQAKKDVTGHHIGLINLGNTCYISSTLHCLSSVPELTSALLSYPDDVKGKSVNEESHNLSIAARDVLVELSQSGNPVAPQHFIQMLRKVHTQFKENTQQDAEECWSQLVQTFDETLTAHSREAALPSIKELFRIGLINRVLHEGSGQYNFQTESVHSLPCCISENVTCLDDGLISYMNRELEKKLSSRESIHCTDESRINELPRYLKIQFARLEWDNELNQNEKKYQKVEYPLVFDVMKFCSDELKLKLKASQQMSRELSSNDTGKDTLARPTEQLTGIYDLTCVLAHLGTAASGHYVAWVKNYDGKWILNDDEIATVHHEYEVLDLCGGDGAEDPVAYVCLYRGRMS